MQQFRVIINDTVALDTYTSDPVTILDFNDPIQVVVKSSNGEIFKNGVVATDLTAHLYQNGAEIDVAGTDYTYAWAKVDKNGTSSSFATDAKTVSVDSNDIDARATFIVTVS
jgi:hypothetical protein